MLGIEDKLLLTPDYWREYCTCESLALNYGISESSAYKTIAWIENTLAIHPDFKLSDNNVFTSEDFNGKLMHRRCHRNPHSKAKRVLFRQKETAHDKIANRS